MEESDLSVDLQWEFFDNRQSEFGNREFKLLVVTDRLCLLKLTDEVISYINNALSTVVGSVKILLVSAETMKPFIGFSYSEYADDSTTLSISHDYKNGDYCHSQMMELTQSILKESVDRNSLVEFPLIYRHAFHAKSPTDISDMNLLEIVYSIDECLEDPLNISEVEA